MSASSLPEGPSLRTLRIASYSAVGMRSVATIRDFSVVSDEPAKAGGENSGPTPMEYMLAGLASCLTVTIRLVSEEQRVAVTDLALALEGDIDIRGLYGQAPVRSDFSEVRGTVRVVGSLTPQELAVLQATTYQRSPAYSLFRHAGIPVTLTWETALEGPQ